MAYDPTKPANNAPIVSAELRNQFAGLKELIDTHPTTDDVSNAITTQAAGSCLGMDYLDMTISDPPTQAEVQALVYKFNNLLAFLRYE